MHFKQKLAFFVFGCVFVIVGQLVTGLVVPSATAQGGLQDAEFNEVTVRKLTVVDEATGRIPAAVLDSNEMGGGRAVLLGMTGVESLSMSAEILGGSLQIRGWEGQVGVSMSAMSGEGHVGVGTLTGDDDVSRNLAGVNIHGSLDGGSVHVADSEENISLVIQGGKDEESTLILAGSKGNMLILAGSDGTTQIKLSGKGDANLLAVADAEGRNRLVAGVGDNKPMLMLSDATGDPRLILNIDTVGHGRAAVAVGQKTLAFIGATEYGGMVSVADMYEQPEAAIGVDDSGDGFVTP